MGKGEANPRCTDGHKERAGETHPSGIRTGLGPLSSLIQGPLAERDNLLSARDCWVENGFPNFATATSRKCQTGKDDPLKNMTPNRTA